MKLLDLGSFYSSLSNHHHYRPPIQPLSSVHLETGWRSGLEVKAGEVHEGKRNRERGEERVC